jgi:hypothetical protein
MIITHLAVSGVGRFRTRHVVKGLGPGLNLLCAPNEHGKSTLFRALQACLFLRHSSETAEIRRLACLGAQIPATIEVGFERAGANYTVQKSFLTSKSSKLFKDGQLIADGPRANELVWSILGLHESGRSVDESTFGLLWVRQGSSFDPVQPNDSARSALNRMIEAEVGQVLGGARGERVRRNIGVQLAREETERGNPKAGGEWKRAADSADKARNELGMARETLNQMEVDFRTLQARLARKEELEEPGSMARMRNDLQVAVEEQAATQRAESFADAAEREAASLAPARELAQRQHRELVALDERIKAARNAIATLEAQAAALEAIRAQHETVRVQGEARLLETARQLAEAERSFDRLNRLSVASAGAQRAANLRTRLQRARALREQIANATATLSAQGLTAKQFRLIKEVAADLEAKRQRMLARAPQVAVRLGAEAGRRVRFQGEILESSRSAAAVTPTLIDVEGIATIQITPVGAAENAKDVEDTQATLARKPRRSRTSAAHSSPNWPCLRHKRAPKTPSRSWSASLPPRRPPSTAGPIRSSPTPSSARSTSQHCERKPNGAAHHGGANAKRQKRYF